MGAPQHIPEENEITNTNFIFDQRKEGWGGVLGAACLINLKIPTIRLKPKLLRITLLPKRISFSKKAKILNPVTHQRNIQFFPRFQVSWVYEITLLVVYAHI